MDYPNAYRYTRTHEWVRVEGDEVVVGITDHAQDQLGDVVYVELPAEGARFQKGEPFGVIESVKAVSDLYAPVGGEVTARNEAVVEAPEQVNESPHDAGWLVRLRLSAPRELDDLLDAEQYRSEIADGEP